MATQESTQQSERTRGQRAGLDLQQIVKVARSMKSGTLSMQSVADALNVDRKALNYHVQDRQSLFQLVALDEFSARFLCEELSAARDWQDACKAYARSFVDGVLSMGEMADNLWFGEPLTLWALEPTETLLKHMNNAGFEDEAAVRLLIMLVTICLGHARDVTAGHNAARRRPQFLKTALGEVHTGTYQNLARILELGIDTYSPQQLDLALDVFLLGASAILSQAPKGPAQETV